MSEFSKLPLSEQYRRLERLREIVVILTAGSEAEVAQLLASMTPAEPLPDAASVADAVAVWLAGGAS